MKDIQAMVAAFHERYGFEVGDVLEKPTEQDLRETMGDAAHRVEVASSVLRRFPRSLAAKRASLVLEEAGELVRALLDGDIVAVADALADLTYVTVGTAVVYGLPMEALIAEVHRSNMTKVPNSGFKPVKGPDYSPPDVAGVLAQEMGE